MKTHKFHDKLIIRHPSNPFKTSFETEELISYFSSDKGREALYLSSPDLLKRFEKKDDSNDFDKKLHLSLLKYALRMHVRSTPFGLSAGCGIGKWHAEHSINQIHSFQRKTRLDMDYTCALSNDLATSPNLSGYLLYYPNSSLYKIGDQYRYIEYNYENNKRTYLLSSIQYTKYIAEILAYSQKGATLNELILELTQQGIGKEEAHNFLSQLINAQLLVSELEPAVTGDEHFSQLIQSLSRIAKRISTEDKNLNEFIAFLKTVQSDLEELDQASVNSLERYQSIIEKLKLIETPFEESKLFQVDTFHSSKHQPDNPIKINASIQHQLYNAINTLYHFSQPEENANMVKFKEGFLERFESQEVPLALVLDSESGLGYANNNNDISADNPLLNEIPFPKNEKANEMRFNRNYYLLIKKIENALIAGKHEIEISSKELVKDKQISYSLPDSMCVHFEHLGLREGKDLLYIKNVGGTSAVNLLGRFASGNEEIKELVLAITEHEKQLNKDAIVAEICHLPENRTGNVLLRPNLRDYEIPYLAQSFLEAEKQLPLSDLMLSMVNGKFILRSKKHNKRVIPKLSNAHNFKHKSLPAYHFLCDLQFEESERNSLSFNWGHFMKQFSFLPRVVVDGVIVMPAYWIFKSKDIIGLNSNELDQKKIFSWKEKWNIPNQVLFVEGDNELLIDFESELSVELFMDLQRKKPSFMIKECLFQPENGILSDKNGHAFSNELIAILLKNKKEGAALNQHASKPAFVQKAQRHFSIGSDWLYFKLYCGVQTADEIIGEDLPMIVQRLKDARLIDHWFFLRYKDADPHVRIRFHLRNKKEIGEVIRYFQEGIEHSRNHELIYKIQTDTYKREVERYGVFPMELSELIFFMDSQSTISAIQRLNEEEDLDLRWMFALKAVDDFLTVLQVDLSNKLDLMLAMRTSFFTEFSVNKTSNKKLDKQYRNIENKIEQVLSDEHSSLNTAWTDLVEILDERYISLKGLVNENPELIQFSFNEKESFLQSHIHMFVNRLFKNKQRQIEVILYNILWKHYKKQLAIKTS